MTDPSVSGPPAPSVATTTCVVVLCADCGDDAWEQYEGVVHWASLADAVKALVRWDWLDPGRPVCPWCRVKRACSTEGHQWGEWRDCCCAGRIDDHGENGCRRYRCCEREVAEVECMATQSGDRKAATDAT